MRVSKKGDFPCQRLIPEPKTETLAETESYLAWKAEEPDGETTYHLELNNVTMHFFKEEWDEFLELVHSLKINLQKDETQQRHYRHPGDRSRPGPG